MVLGESVVLDEGERVIMSEWCWIRESEPRELWFIYPCSKGMEHYIIYTVANGSG